MGLDGHAVFLTGDVPDGCCIGNEVPTGDVEEIKRVLGGANQMDRVVRLLFRAESDAGNPV